MTSSDKQILMTSLINRKGATTTFSDSTTCKSIHSSKDPDVRGMPAVYEGNDAQTINFSVDHTLHAKLSDGAGGYQTGMTFTRGANKFKIRKVLPQIYADIIQFIILVCDAEDS